MPTTVATPEDVQAVEDLATGLAASVAGLATDVADLKTRVQAVEDAPATPPSYEPVAYVGMPYTVISEPTEGAVRAGIDAWLANRSGYFPKTKLVFAYIGKANLTQPLLPADTGQIQGARWEGMSKRGTQLGWGNATTPLLSAYGQLRNWEFKDLTFASTTGGAKGLYLHSSTSASNQDGAFRRIEFTGSWDYGIALDGPSNANLNSEIAFEGLACSNDASFGAGLFVSGLSGDDAQEDQFLNYSFRDTKLEGSHGDYLVFNKGGSITFDGFNSWLHTGQKNGGVPAGTMLKMPVTSHFDSVQTLVASHIRTETRGAQSRFMDCGWSSSARLLLQGLDTGANAFKFKPGASIGGGSPEDITLRNGAHVHLLSPSLGGYIALRDKGGVVTMDDLKIVPGTCVASCTDGAGSGVVRNFTTTTTPSVAFR